MSGGDNMPDDINLEPEPEDDDDQPAPGVRRSLRSRIVDKLSGSKGDSGRDD